MIEDLGIKIFADGADLQSILKFSEDPLIKGVTTNPTLMRQAGVEDYEAFARELLDEITDMPVSLEVLADDFDTMEAQALEIASWGANVNVKIPISNTAGASACELIGRLSRQGVMVNATAILSLDQVRGVAAALDPEVPAIVSVFAGRVADTGIDPVPHMREALEILSERPKAELLWASPRELLNLFQANEIGCHIITATGGILNKLHLIGKNLDSYSRETVEMFYRDATAAGYAIDVQKIEREVA